MMTPVYEGVIIVAGLIREQILKKRHQKKRIWVKKWVPRENELDTSNNLRLEVLTEDEETFKNMFRVSKEQFQFLLDKIGASIQKENTILRNAIPARTKLEIALKYLATGDSFGTLSQMFRVPKSTMSTFLIDVLSAIYSTLEEYIKVPMSEDGWNAIKQGFLQKWNIPNCVGALDAKHINLKCPPGSGTDFHNYKDSFSIVLMALVDYNYCFTYIDVGTKERNSEGGIFNNCTLKRAIEENTINLPSDSVIVGDETFPLKPYLLKPYPRRNNLTKEQIIYNYRLGRCGRIVENAFGILAAQFRVFEKPIAVHSNKVDIIVKTACALHNWLRKTSPASYTPSGYIDEECPLTGTRPGIWRESGASQAFSEIGSQNNRKNTKEAIDLRDSYCHYFNNAGAMSWQENVVFQ